MKRFLTPPYRDSGEYPPCSAWCPAHSSAERALCAYGWISTPMREVIAFTDRETEAQRGNRKTALPMSKPFPSPLPCFCGLKERQDGLGGTGGLLGKRGDKGKKQPPESAWQVPAWSKLKGEMPFWWMHACAAYCQEMDTTQFFVSLSAMATRKLRIPFIAWVTTSQSAPEKPLLLLPSQRNSVLIYVSLRNP